jgi:E3 ubiquitin-protein ligase RNF14
MDDFHWCVKPKCGSGQLHNPDQQGPIMTCYSCHMMQCTRHERAWHKGETCRQYDARILAGGSSSVQKKAEEEESRKTIERVSKKCPKASCGARIQKNDGCDHMTCKSLCLMNCEPWIRD